MTSWMMLPATHRLQEDWRRVQPRVLPVLQRPAPGPEPGKQARAEHDDDGAGRGRVLRAHILED